LAKIRRTILQKQACAPDVSKKNRTINSHEAHISAVIALQQAKVSDLTHIPAQLSYLAGSDWRHEAYEAQRSATFDANTSEISSHDDKTPHRAIVTRSNK